MINSFQLNKKSESGHVNFEMFYKVVFFCVSFAALVALERLLPSVRRHVLLQVTGRSASEVALDPDFCAMEIGGIAYFT